MKLLYLSLLILFVVTGISVADPIDKVADLIRQENIHELSKLFASNIDITILEEENIYSKTQAELILDKFFSQNKPEAVKILHKVNSNKNYRFGVLLVTAAKETFRITFTLKETEGSFTIIELRIEIDKVK
jgi:response regulator of citrate/malate metabolism